MLRILRNSFITKALAVYLTFTMVFDVLLTSQSFALTGGPAAPEYNSFEPITTNQMVDLFSGDFTYNIPLMTVPGPNGGYPINMAYHGGIGLEQEASWTGLGWNVNVGAINRNKRGLPDDFAGETLTKEFNLKPSSSISLRFDRTSVLPDEILGAEISIGRNVQVYYNNYKGFGWRAGLGLSAKTPEVKAGSGKESKSIVGSLDFTFDSNNSSLGFSGNVGFGKITEEK